MPTEKPDLQKGLPLAAIPDGRGITGMVDDDEVLLVRHGRDVFAVGAHCTHYHGPLADGLVIDDQVRCPWHHACFSLRTGEAVRAPALDPIPCWRVEVAGENVFVREKFAPAAPVPITGKVHPSSVLIAGGGAAGLAAADMLRRRGYSGPITMLSADSAPPCDRPNLSKDFLAGTAQDEWIPLRPLDWYSHHKINLVLNSRAVALDPKQKKITTEGGKIYDYEALLLATGADPVKLPLEGASPSQLFYLRSFADSKAIIAKTTSAKQAVIVGASFIGLEVAASLRARSIAVHVVAPETVPMEKTLGPEVGAFVRSLHETHGVVFHLGQTVRRVSGSNVILANGEAIPADFIVLGVGVRASLALAEQGGLKTDRGILVDEYLQTSTPGVFAAGDAVRWPDSHTGEPIRVEHWVVAERQGQTAAKNMLGARERFDAVPFFWSQHYDVPINYVGHAEQWDAIEIDGELDKKDCAVSYKRKGRILAVATIFRDLHSLSAESAIEKQIETYKREID
jgi:NADPH-dependent 2,4-dienoyl-CoA reductase/sulfur reductase-like enzyme/nitrite reductase/ring-hydroxylating ferredoxin subunit